VKHSDDDAGLGRRPLLRWLAGAAAVPAIGCGSSNAGQPQAETATGGAVDGSCAAIPGETAGPFPGDGSNGPNALTLPGIVRSDIRTSIADASGTAEGVPLTVKLTIVNSNAACARLAGLAVYVWHCDRDGDYSLYTKVEQNYLRGVQESDADGTVTFQTIFPACYPGRWPHIHLEVYASVADAARATGLLATSQLALPEATCHEVYATSGYEASVQTLKQVSLSSDGVFADGSDRQLASVEGSAEAGYVASLTVAVEA
jgi:protocatechuate 3,4-dioxygenase beta subunit